MLKVDDKLIAKWTETYVDHVTEGNTYVVSKVTDIGFYIINDKREECFPISSQFNREEVLDNGL
jgi:hypothetical protein